MMGGGRGLFFIVYSFGQLTIPFPGLQVACPFCACVLWTESEGAWQREVEGAWLRERSRAVS